MSRFLSFNSDDPNTQQTALAANGSTTVGPIQVSGSGKIVGSCFSDTAGTLLVQQTFDFWNSGGSGVNSSPHWDVTQSYSITANQPTTVDVDVVAPVAQVVFNNSNNQQQHLRIFLRAYGPGK